MSKIYICNSCNYSTSDHSNFSKHESTDKHKQICNIDNNQKYMLSNKCPEDVRCCPIRCPDKKKIVCNLCGLEFTDRSNLYRHKKHRCTKKNIQVDSIAVHSAIKPIN